MKKNVLALILFFGISIVSFGRIIAEGETLSTLGKFTIETTDEPVMISGEGLQSYLVTYENSPLVLKVVVDRQKDCKNYIVINDQLSIMYTCDGNYLGVSLIDNKYKSAGFSTNTDALDKSCYFHQRVICRGVSSDVEVFKLIAVYFPELIKG